MSQIEIVEEKTITLRNPIAVGKGDARIEYTELKLREPTAGELTKAGKAGDSNDVLLSMIQQVTQLPRQVVESISMREMNECADFFAQFSNSGSE